VLSNAMVTRLGLFVPDVMAVTVVVGAVTLVTAVPVVIPALVKNDCVAAPVTALVNVGVTPVTTVVLCPPRCTLLRCMRAKVAHRDVALRWRIFDTIGSEADMPTASVVGRSGENDRFGHLGSPVAPHFRGPAGADGRQL